MVNPGETYLHFKKGNRYLVLLVADMKESEFVQEGTDVVIYAQYGVISATKDRDLDVFRRHDAPIKLLEACYTGKPKHLISDERLVIYVGLYDNPHGNRVCVRPESEWESEINNVPRYRLEVK